MSSLMSRVVMRIESAHVQVILFTVTSTTRCHEKCPHRIRNDGNVLDSMEHVVMGTTSQSSTRSLFCFRTLKQRGFARLSESHRPLSLKMWMPGINLVTSVSEGCPPVLLVPYCWVHSHPPNDDLQ